MSEMAFAGAASGSGLTAGMGGIKTAGEIARPMALPIGILLVGVGGILLFIAFHNVPSNITDLSGLIGWVIADLNAGPDTAARASAEAQPEAPPSAV